MKKLGFIFILMILFLPFSAFAGVVINEIAWMGTAENWRYEWLELYNNSDQDIILDGWEIELSRTEIDFVINPQGTIPARGYFLIVSSENIFSDYDYNYANLGGKFVNTGTVLILRDGEGAQIDKIDASEGWPAGDNETKETMQKSGSGWLTGSATSKAQNIQISGEDGGQEDQETSEESSSSVSSEYIPPEELPSIKAYAGEDRVLVAGARAEFRGKAFGLKDEPLDNARYLWNFGDGSVGEGQNITHFYRYPGEYVVVLSVSLGEYSASDRFLAKAVPGEIYISEIKTGVDSFIEFYNASGEEINLSGWRFRFAYQNYFTFSAHTFIRPAGYLVIPSSSSGIIFSQGRGEVEFLYPGGLVADSFEYNGNLEKAQSFSRLNENIVIAPESPGFKNKEPVYVSQHVGNDYDILADNVSGRQKEQQKDSEEKQENYENEENRQLFDNQQANVVSVASDNGKSTGRNYTIYYFLAVLTLILFAGIGFVVVRRKSGV